MAKGFTRRVAGKTGLRHIGELTPDPQNARKHGPRNVGTIVAGLHEVGAARSIVIDEAGVILAGNATVEAAAEAGITKLRVVDVDGQTVVAVRRTGLSDAQKARLALIDNRASELAEGWDAGVLRALQGTGVSLDGLWEDDELAALLGMAEPEAGLTDPDDVPSLRPTSIQPGDVFQLGIHRLLCGDSTDPVSVSTVLSGTKPLLMVTDPPYGVNYDPKWRREAGVNQSDRMGSVANDDRADWTPAWQLFAGPVAYVWHAGLFASVVQSSLQAARLEVRSQIVWRKNRFALGRGSYHWQHEPCWYAVRAGQTSHWNGSRKEATTWDVPMAAHRCCACGSVSVEDVPGSPLETTVWDIDTQDDTGHTQHGTQKPVECMERPIRNHGGPGDAIYEPFSGSGTTLIASERQRRPCFAIELTPAYVQMAIDRWEAYTGLKASKAGELPPR